VSKPSLRTIRPPRTSIHVLDDDSLFNIFNLCRPIVLEEVEYGGIRWGDWVPERWWHKFVQVCQRWRYLILGSASHLGLCLVCTDGMPVADMLAHSPSFPLIIDYNHPRHDLTVEDEEGIMLALQHRDRVRRIRLKMPVPSLQKLLTAIDHQFPMLEFVSIQAPTKHDSHLTLPLSFEAPQLRCLILDHFNSPIESPFLTTAVGLVFLFLRWIHPSTYPHPDHLLQPLSLLPQLEKLEITFGSPVPSGDIERQLLTLPIMTQATLPNLRLFVFRGACSYLEALLPQMATPLLTMLNVQLFHQPNFSVPGLLRFMTTTGKIRFSIATFLFYYEAVAVFIDPVVKGKFISLCLEVICGHLDWQVSSMAQIFNALSPLFSVVVDLNLDYREHSSSSERPNGFDRIPWRELLGAFSNVKTLRVHSGLVGELSRSLKLDGEPPLELLPELKELVCPMGSVDDKIFTSFIHDREVAGQPVALIGDAFPVGRTCYRFFSPTGEYYVGSDPDPLP
jgi:hypothetical protein